MIELYSEKGHMIIVSYNNLGKSSFKHMSWVVYQSEIIFCQELRIVSWRIEWISWTKKITLVKSIQTLFHHFLGEFFIVDFELTVRVEFCCLVLCLQFEV